MFRNLFASASATAFLFMWLSCNGEPWQGKEPGDILVCNEKNATFIWNWVIEPPSDSIDQIDWKYIATGNTILLYIKDDGISTTEAYGDRPDYVKSLGNAAIVIQNISEYDNGKYRVSLTADTVTYTSENANLTVVSVEEVTNCFADFKMTIDGNSVDVSTGTTNIAVDPGTSSKIVLQIPNGCNNEADCFHNGKSCGMCHLATECTFTVNQVVAGTNINIKVTPCQGVEYIYQIPVSGSSTPIPTTSTPIPTTSTPTPRGSKPGLTDAQIAGIVVGVLILCVIIIVAIVLVLKKKNITNNPVNNDGQNAKNDISKTEAQKNAKKAKETSKEKTRSSEKGQDQPSTPTTISEVTFKDERVANEKIDSPRKLPPLTLPPVNKVNPEDDPDDQEQKKKKKKKHKKRHHEEDEGQGVDHEDNGQINTGYDIDRTEN